MAVLLLVSSTGFVIVEHTCEMKGKSLTAHLGEREVSSCCGTKVAATDTSPVAEQASGIQKNPCCKEKAVLSSTTVAISTEASSIQWVVPTASLALATYFALGGKSFSGDAHSANHPYPGPPPISSSLHKALLCTWLI
jgi:hypothetical protein